jgi:hypothetical protein
MLQQPYLGRFSEPNAQKEQHNNNLKITYIDPQPWCVLEPRVQKNKITPIPTATSME